MPEDDVSLSDDGKWWWDGQDWQPVPEQWLNAGETVGDVVHISADEYPAIGQVLEFAHDFDQYLTNIGIDPGEIVEPPKANA